MANIKLGPLVAEIRGALGGIVFSRGAGGAIARTNPKPINPRSPAQQLTRANMAYLSQYWSSTLTDIQRATWRTYAGNTSWTNKVGTAAKISGLAAFVRLNCLLLLGGYTLQPAAPAEYGHAGTPIFTFAADGADLGIDIAEPGPPYDNIIPLSIMMFFMRGSTNVGRVALTGQRRYLGTVVGETDPGPTWPPAFISELGFSNGQVVSVSGVFIDPLGRVGSEYVAQAIAATP